MSYPTPPQPEGISYRPPPTRIFIFYFFLVFRGSRVPFSRSLFPMGIPLVEKGFSEKARKTPLNRRTDCGMAEHRYGVRCRRKDLKMAFTGKLSKIVIFGWWLLSVFGQIIHGFLFPDVGFALHILRGRLSPRGIRQSPSTAWAVQGLRVFRRGLFFGGLCGGSPGIRFPGRSPGVQNQESEGGVPSPAPRRPKPGACGDGVARAKTSHSIIFLFNYLFNC